MKIFKKLKQQEFEIQHIVILFTILIIFQIVVSLLNKFSINRLLNDTLQLYKEDSAEKIGSLTTNSLELTLENSFIKQKNRNELRKKEIIEALNIHFGQQKMQTNIDEICVIAKKNGDYLAIDEGDELYRYFFAEVVTEDGPSEYNNTINKYKQLEQKLKNNEVIYTSVIENRIFDVFVPFTPKGEYEGVVYLKITPSLSSVKRGITNTLNETSLIFTALILFGLLAMFYITTYTVDERDKAKEKLIQEHAEKVKKEIAYEKEVHFTKRIYHAHHKAEKIMGFIKDEVEELTCDNIEQFKKVVNRYSNFVSRVIYEMKWKNPPMHAIRSPIFNTDINEVVEFLVNNIFQRLSSKTGSFEFKMDLDEELPSVNINEYVVWEILEPLMQNSIDHNQKENVIIEVITRYNSSENRSKVKIRDNGKGIPGDLMEENSEGIEKIFCEDTSNKEDDENRGYGCYIAYEISVKRCGWNLEVDNLEQGCEFTITIG